MSIFTNSDIISGENFSHALTNYDPSALDPLGFSPSQTLSVVVDKDGITNVAKTLLSHAKKDPVDCTKIPEFSTSNKFIKGIEKAINTVPPGGIILYNQGDPFRPPTGSLPAGYVFCDGRSYFKKDGTTWRVPKIPPLDTAVYIQKLPPDVTLEVNPFAIRPVTPRR